MQKVIVFVVGAVVGYGLTPYTYKGINVDEASKLLSDNGFTVQRAQGPQGQPYLTSVVHDYPFEVHFYNCDSDKKCQTMQFSLGIKKTAATSLGLINGWNGNERMAKAYLVDQGVLLQMDMILNGGVTIPSLEYHMNAWKSIAPKFEEVLRTGAL